MILLCELKTFKFRIAPLVLCLFVFDACTGQEFPGPTRLEVEPSHPIRGGTLTLSCVVDDPGGPPVQFYTWTKGSHHHIEISTAKWTISPITVLTRGKYSCQGVSEAGRGRIGRADVDVFAPPALLKGLDPFTTFNAHEHEHAHPSLSCQVHCYPKCEIQWFKNSEPISTAAAKFKIEEKLVPANSSTGNFESVISTLTWNERLDKVKDNGNYSCVSSSNEYGPGLNSTTQLIVEYKPECKISAKDLGDGSKILTCAVDANPSQVKFHWWFSNPNRTKIEETSEKILIAHKNSPKNYGKYICLAENSVGISEPCEFTLYDESDYLILILIGLICGLALIVILLAAIISICCLRNISDRSEGIVPIKFSAAARNDKVICEVTTTTSIT